MDEILFGIYSDGNTSNLFGVTKGTKQGCVMVPVWFALFFSVMLKQAFSDTGVGVKLQFLTSGGLLNDQRFKANTQVRITIICDLLFAENAALTAASLEETVSC